MSFTNITDHCYILPNSIYNALIHFSKLKSSQYCSWQIICAEVAVSEGAYQVL